MNSGFGPKGKNSAGMGMHLSEWDPELRNLSSSAFSQITIISSMPRDFMLGTPACCLGRYYFSLKFPCTQDFTFKKINILSIGKSVKMRET